MCKFDVYLPVEGTEYAEYITSVYADSQEEAEELAQQALQELDLVPVRRIIDGEIDPNY